MTCVQWEQNVCEIVLEDSYSYYIFGQDVFLTLILFHKMFNEIIFGAYNTTSERLFSQWWSLLQALGMLTEN